jgi:DNA polymerase (family 10)
MPFVPPEVRENRGEFEGGIEFEALVAIEDMRGDLHVHSTASDGRNTIEEMAVAARDRGYEYIAIADHTRSSTIANGLSAERMAEHIEEVRGVDARIDGITILVSCECDILPDGTLDYPNELLARCDLVMASIHSAMAKGKLPPTERTCAAMENRYVDLIGHPTGRLLGERPPMHIDMARIVQVAAEHGVALEVNGAWQRLDLKDLHVRQAVEAGVPVVINTDAHSVEGLEHMRFGVKTARRGLARSSGVLNTLPAPELLRRLRRHRA